MEKLESTSLKQLSVSRIVFDFDGMLNVVFFYFLVGRAPVNLFGPKENDVSMYLVFTTRDGKGISLVRNKQPYDSVWNKEVSKLTFKNLIYRPLLISLVYRMPTK